jgi:hypothetical protein
VSQAKALVREVQSLCEQRQGRLAALTVRAPTGIPMEELRTQLVRDLDALGFDGLDLTIVPNGHPLRIQSAEFEP